MKECYYIENTRSVYYGFSWYLPDVAKDTPACKCIMAVDKGKTIGMDELNELLTRRTITNEEYNAIRTFDNQCGTIDDLKIIEALAKRLKVKLVRK